MQEHSRVKTHDNIRVQVWRVSPQGVHQLAREWTTHNLVTTAGKTVIANRLAGLSAVPVLGWFAIGTGVAEPVMSDVLLGAEILRAPLTNLTLTAPGVLTATYYLDTSTGNGSTLGEIGLFNVVTANTATLIARALLSPVIAKTSALAVTFTWTVTIG